MAEIISNTCCWLGKTYRQDFTKTPACISKSLPPSEGHFVPSTDVIGPCQRGNEAVL
ncbi:hypothetical protein IG631_09376 [Alternaria alternata]|nr:hypothetical protein IG631_09376 [Alternaria alternata]